MGYQQGPYGPPPGQGQPQQGGYQQQPQQGYPPNQYNGAPPGYTQQPQQQGYGPPAGGGGPDGYDWGALYGMADHSAGQTLPVDNYDAVVEEASWGRTKDGTKGAWTIVYRITSGQYRGVKRTMTLSVTETKQDGQPNKAGMGIMFRQLGAMGVPVPPNQPWWQLGWDAGTVAQNIVGKPVQLRTKHDEWEGVTRDKIADVKPPRPGAPTTWEGPEQGPQGGSPYGGPQQPQGAPQGWTPPGMPGQPPQGQQGPPPGQDAYGNQFQGQPQGPPAGAPPYNPNVPGYAQQPYPGQPGVGQFTQQGQAMQPGTVPQHDGYNAPGQPPAQQPPHGAQPPGYGAGPAQQQQGQQPPPDQGGAPQAPPWAQ